MFVSHVTECVCSQAASSNFNIQSAKEIAALLFNKPGQTGGVRSGLGLPPPPGCKTKRGYSTTRAVLQASERRSCLLCPILHSGAPSANMYCGMRACMLCVIYGLIMPT